MPQDELPAGGPAGPAPDDGTDWRDLFFLNAFLLLSLSDRQIERRERVWIKRFLWSRGKPQLDARIEAMIARRLGDRERFEELTRRAAAELSKGEKRRFVRDLAQLVQSKGAISAQEYESILDLAEKIGVADTDADAMIRSVYDINKTFIAIMGLLAVGVILYFTRSVVVPLVIAIFITMIVDKVERPLASALHLRRGRWLTKLGAMVLILAACFGLAMAAVVSGAEIANRIPFYEARLTSAVHGSSVAQTVFLWLREHGVIDQVQNLSLGSVVTGFLGSLVSLLGNFVLVVIFTGFLVFSSSSFTGVLEEMNDNVGAYISIKTLVCLLTGLVTLVVCALFGVDFALFWALLAFLLNFVPSVGSIIATLPPIALAVVQLDSWTATGFFIVLLVLPQTLLGQVIEPKLMGNRLAIKPLAILLGLIFWGLLWGIPGMFLATPLMVLLKILSSYFNFSRGFERLLSAEPVAPDNG
jgi:AI-2 transport protein TqsA